MASAQKETGVFALSFYADALRRRRFRPRRFNRQAFNLFRGKNMKIECGKIIIAVWILMVAVKRNGLWQVVFWGDTPEPMAERTGQ